MTTPKPAQHWLEKGHLVPWRVVKADEKVVGLSGPGMARRYKEVPLDEFLKNWREVDPSKIPKPVKKPVKKRVRKAR